MTLVHMSEESGNAAAAAAAVVGQVEVAHSCNNLAAEARMVVGEEQNWRNIEGAGAA
jgi:hypothetical protein